jgi:hypothetical protein
MNIKLNILHLLILLLGIVILYFIYNNTSKLIEGFSCVKPTNADSGNCDRYNEYSMCPYVCIDDNCDPGEVDECKNNNPKVKIINKGTDKCITNYYNTNDCKLGDVVKRSCILKARNYCHDQANKTEATNNFNKLNNKWCSKYPNSTGCSSPDAYDDSDYDSDGDPNMDGGSSSGNNGGSSSGNNGGSSSGNNDGSSSGNNGGSSSGNNGGSSSDNNGGSSSDNNSGSSSDNNGGSSSDNNGGSSSDNNSGSSSDNNSGSSSNSTNTDAGSTNNINTSGDMNSDKQQNDLINNILRFKNYINNTANTANTANNNYMLPSNRYNQQHQQEEQQQYSTQNNYSTIPSSSSNNLGRNEDLYILKSSVVPPVCPACPNIVVNKTLLNKKCPDCTPCARCPEPAFECKKTPNYSLGQGSSYLPRPILNDFSTFGM